MTIVLIPAAFLLTLGWLLAWAARCRRMSVAFAALATITAACAYLSWRGVIS